MTNYRTWSIPVFALVILSEFCPVFVEARSTSAAETRGGSLKTPAPTKRTTQTLTRTNSFSGTTLTAEDMTLIAAEQSPQIQTRLASDKEARKDFAKNIRELLAVAEEAQAGGMGERPDIKRQFDLMRSVVIAQFYFKSQPGQVSGSPTPNLSDAEIEQFYLQPDSERKFEVFLKDAQAKNPHLAGDQIPAAQLKQVKQQFGQVLIGEQKGVQAGLDKKRFIQLQILLEQARVLASIYASEQLVPQTAASEQEIDTYIEQHPELDTKLVRAKAEAVLKRARAGEDFAKLAQEFSVEHESKDNGGDLGWFGLGVMVPEFEKAAFALRVGQISDVIETKFGFHIIKIEGSRLRDRRGKPKRQVRARHILISWGLGTDLAAPIKPPRDQARAAIEQGKQTQVLDEIVKRSHVTVSDDFRANAPPPNGE